MWASMDDEESLTAPRANQSQCRGYLGALAPLLVALIVLSLTTQHPGQSLYYNQSWITHGRRRLYHPHNAAAFFLCTRMLSNSDGNFDNSLTMDEFKEFANTYAEHKYSTTVGQNLPKDLREIFNKYAQETEGKSNQIIDIYGSRNGERDGITKHQGDLLEALCNATSNTLDNMFAQEQKDLGETAEENVSTDAPTEVSCWPQASHFVIMCCGTRSGKHLKLLACRAFNRSIYPSIYPSISTTPRPRKISNSLVVKSFLSMLLLP